MTVLTRPLLKRALATSLWLMLLCHGVQAQTVGAIQKFVFPFAYYALAASGEPVQFVGTSTFESQLIKDPVAGDQLLITVYWTDVKGTAYPSLTTYLVSGSENVVRPNASSQSMEITFPMVPVTGSRLTTTRTGVATISFLTSTTTGAILGVTSGVISIK